MLRYSDSYAGAGQPLSAKQLNNLGQETQRLVAASKTLPAGDSGQDSGSGTGAVTQITIYSGSRYELIDRVETLIPARGTTRGTSGFVWVAGDDDKSLRGPHSFGPDQPLRSVFAVLDSLRTYTFAGETAPYYRSFTHDVQTQRGTFIINGQYISVGIGRNNEELLPTRIIPYAPRISLGGPCLFQRDGQYGTLLGFLGTRIYHTGAFFDPATYTWVSYYPDGTKIFLDSALTFRLRRKDSPVEIILALDADNTVRVQTRLNSVINLWLGSYNADRLNHPDQTGQGWSPNAHDTLQYDPPVKPPGSSLPGVPGYI